MSEKGVQAELWGDFPEGLKNPRTGFWPEISLVVPLHVDGPEPDLLAAKRVVLPRVPMIGEEFEVAARWARVERVRWSREHPPFVRLQPLPAVFPGLLEALEAEGFRMVSPDDPDAWLASIDDQ